MMTFDEWAARLLEGDPDQIRNAEKTPSEVSVAYLSRFMRESGRLSIGFGDDELASAVRTLRSWLHRCARRPELSLAHRAAAVLATEVLYRDVCAARCLVPFDPSRRSATGMDKLAQAFFMFWDLPPRSNDADPSEHNEAVSNALARILQIDNSVCRWSALHGLSHWWHTQPGIATSIVDAFLATKDIPETQRTYAQTAREGLCM